MNAPQPAQRSTAAVVVQSLMWLWLIFLSVLAALGYQALSDQADQERLTEGISAPDYETLTRLIEDYIS